MKNTIKKLASTVALTLATCTLTAGMASAQSVQRVSLDRPVLRANDFIDIRSTSNRLIAPREDVAWPAVIAAAAAVVKVATVVAHHVTESFVPQPGLRARGNLINIGAYDR